MANNNRKAKAAKAASKARRDASFLASRGCVRAASGAVSVPAPGAVSVPAPAAAPPSPVHALPTDLQSNELLPCTPALRTHDLEVEAVPEKRAADIKGRESAPPSAAAPCPSPAPSVPVPVPAAAPPPPVHALPADLQPNELLPCTPALRTHDLEVEAVPEKRAADTKGRAAAPPSAAAPCPSPAPSVPVPAAAPPPPVHALPADLQPNEMLPCTPALPTHAPEIEAVAQGLAADIEGRSAATPPASAPCPSPAPEAQRSTNAPPAPAAATEAVNSANAAAAQACAAHPPTDAPPTDATCQVLAAPRAAGKAAGVAPPREVAPAPPSQQSAVLPRAGRMAVLGATTAVLGAFTGAVVRAATYACHTLAGVVGACWRRPRAAWRSWWRAMTPRVWAAVEAGAAAAVVA